MNKMTKKMIEIYKPYSNMDWMNYQLKREDLSYHHIVKKCNGGSKDVTNGALLQKNTSHPYLHLIESIDMDVYCKINKIFSIVNRQQEEPNELQRKAIEWLLLQFEREHRWDKSPKGKLLIQKKYLQRNL